MRVSRRNLLKGLALGSGSMLLPTMAQRILANGCLLYTSDAADEV